MIKTVTLKNFKQFRDVSFDTSDSIVLAGPNNSGKTTLLQAVTTWNLALRKWLAERGPGSGSTAKKRTGVAITRKDFTSIPLSDMNLLWTNRSTALYKDELIGNQSPGAPRPICIEVEGDHADGKTCPIGLEFIYRHPEVVHVRPVPGVDIDVMASVEKGLQVVHVPPFSGIGVEETHYDRAYQDWLVGQGKPGDILRNLLLEISKERPDDWNRLCSDINAIFGYELQRPEYSGSPFIVCGYRDLAPGNGSQRGNPKLDIACAGSGFLQVVMLLGFFYARPSSVLLMDEPDAHLHVILQKQVFDRLRRVSRERGCQLIVATHSEVIIDNTAPENIMSFLRKREPHRLGHNKERDQVREALGQLTSLEIVEADRVRGALYLESESDLSTIQEIARVTDHPVARMLSDDLLVHYLRTNSAQPAKRHYFAIKAIRPGLRGLLLLDGDNRDLDDHEITAEGLTILRWRRYEIESYLVHPEALLRFVTESCGGPSNLFAPSARTSGETYLSENLPPAVFKDPTESHDYLNTTPASKKLLPAFFDACGVPITKNEYYQIAAQMKPDEIPKELLEKLDEMYRVFAEES